jgi:hypothetical protein
MSSFVSTSEKQVLTGLYGNTFDTFSRDIVIYKQPIKQALITGPTNPGIFGFGDGQVSTQYTYTPVSGVYPAIVRYVNVHHNVSAAEVVDETNTFVGIGEVVIKVKPDCYSFIENGQTDKFTFDGKDFYFAGKAKAMPFLGALFYTYQLKVKP